MACTRADVVSFALFLQCAHRSRVVCRQRRHEIQHWIVIGRLDVYTISCITVVYNMNNIGPRTDPCGTPRVNYCRSDRVLSKNFRSMPLSRSMLLSTVSKAALMSSKPSCTMSPRSTLHLRTIFRNFPPKTY